MEYIRNVEKITFWASESRKLHIAKLELLTQIKNSPISVNAKGFFTIDRPFLAGVSFHYYPPFQIYEQIEIAVLVSLQMAATCCTYAIIFIQFLMASGNNSLAENE